MKHTAKEIIDSLTLSCISMIKGLEDVIEEKDKEIAELKRQLAPNPIEPDGLKNEVMSHAFAIMKILLDNGKDIEVVEKLHNLDIGYYTHPKSHDLLTVENTCKKLHFEAKLAKGTLKRKELQVDKE